MGPAALRSFLERDASLPAPVGHPRLHGPTARNSSEHRHARTRASSRFAHLNPCSAGAAPSSGVRTGSSTAPRPRVLAHPGSVAAGREGRETRRNPRPAQPWSRRRRAATTDAQPVDEPGPPTPAVRGPLACGRPASAGAASRVAAQDPPARAARPPAGWRAIPASPRRRAARPRAGPRRGRRRGRGHRLVRPRRGHRRGRPDPPDGADGIARLQSARSWAASPVSCSYRSPSVVDRHAVAGDGDDDASDPHTGRRPCWAGLRGRRRREAGRSAGRHPGHGRGRPAGGRALVAPPTVPSAAGLPVAVPLTRTLAGERGTTAKRRSVAAGCGRRTTPTTSTVVPSGHGRRGDSRPREARNDDRRALRTHLGPPAIAEALQVGDFPVIRTSSHSSPDRARGGGPAARGP